MHLGLSLSLICTDVVDDCVFNRTSKMDEKKNTILDVIYHLFDELKLKCDWQRFKL